MINFEAAIEILRGRNLQCGNANVLKQPLQLAISALEKQVPKEPISNTAAERTEVSKNVFFGKGTTVYRCPSCGMFITLTHKFCWKCGQALKFPEVKNVSN